MSAQATTFDWDLIQRYNAAGPRYTSYPTAVQFTDAFCAQDYLEQADRSNVSGTPLSIYVHIPFCSHLCFYCGCNKIVTKNMAKGDAYLERLLKEIALQGKLFDTGRLAEQMHFGGGTPTFYDLPRIERILDAVGSNFNLYREPKRDFSIEIDPRTVDPDTIAGLHELGFNRMSIGVQDFDPAVQKAVHRIQSAEQTLSIMHAARDAQVRSVNVDLIYGLPMQSASSLDTTIRAVIDADPDRICIFNYAHLPERFPPQRRINDDDLPSADEKLVMLQSTVETLMTAGYRYIGMDHFAKPQDELSLAQDHGHLHRNFQGYTTHAECDLVGIGVSSIASVHDCYSQNHYGLDDYYRCIDEDRIPVARGLTLDADDRLRKHVIMQLMCFGTLDFSEIETEHDIDFSDYFRLELERLREMEADGLLTLTSGHLSVTAAGWTLVRNISAVFDKYLPQTSKQRFSRFI
ncbi:MAG: oxygen-independent coproporphyrinogen III oxidase [Gammaproteobacteria bacterium]|nr:oxygen-independent coproporphyrinogen III oxidase [Gammaproteobacteria bacterium]